MQRKASVIWQGPLKTGGGTLATQSGALQARYGFKDRFGEGQGTNPEELVAAAHAGCFSMALSGILEKAGIVPEKIDTSATVSLDRQDGSWTVTGIHLDVKAKVPREEESAFQAAAEQAKNDCPISRALRAPVTLEARVV